MFDKFTISGYRGFRELDLNDLARVNLIVGGNNSGKTTLLEAWQMLCLPGQVNNPEGLSLTRNAERFTPKEEFNLGWWFHKRDVTRPISIEARRRHLKDVPRRVSISLVDVPPGMVDNELLRSMHPWQLRIDINDPFDKAKPRRSVVIKATESKAMLAPIPCACLLPGVDLRNLKQLAEWYSQVDMQNGQEEVLALLRQNDPRLTRLSVASIGGHSFLQADVGLGPLMPVSFLGDGSLRLLAFAIKMSQARRGVLLVDEIDTGLQRSGQTRLWEYIREAAPRLDVQIFATTHSWDAIAAAHQAFATAGEDEFTILRLDRRDDGVTVFRFDREATAAAIEGPIEIRE